MTQTENSQGNYQGVLASCQLILRATTGIILAAFVLIILMTTASTGEVVRMGGKVLYYIIVFSILVSLAVWLYRVRLEKRLEAEEISSE